MSGFAVIFDRSNSPVEPGVLERVMQRLAHRGPDGQDTWYSGSIAMGHWHFWTTPEEVDEHQPIKLPELPYTIVLDGRLDNRSDLINRLSITSEEASHLSDAVLIILAYDRWGTSSFKDLIGEFALVIWDEYHKELICARDAVGDRTLFYNLQKNQLILSSEPWAVAAGMNQQVALEERAIAYHFAMQIPEDGQTFFTGIFELLPAHWMKVGAGFDQKQQYWQPTSEKRDRNRSDADYAEEFRELLETSIHCRLRSSTTPGIMLSGGLDSTSIACLAARMIAPKQLTTLSYVFDQFSECDERSFIDAVTEQYGTRSIQIPCDDLWPYKTWPNWPMTPNWPPANPYRLILERTYSRARDEGIRVLLTGMYGDNLYVRSQDWLSDLLLDGRLEQFTGEITNLVKKYGFRKVISSKVLWRAMKQVAVTIPGVENFRRKSFPPKWLTPLSLSLLEQTPINENSIKQSALLNLRDAASNSREIDNSNQHDLELRTPYHDRRLIEFVMGLPGYALFSHGVTRQILRKAMTGILPEIVISRIDKTSLNSFYQFGVENRRIEIEKSLIVNDNSWQKFVQADVVLKEWQTVGSQNNGGESTLLPVLSIFFELWYKSFFNAQYGSRYEF